MLSIMSGIYMKMKKTGLVDILGPTQAAWNLIPSCIGTYVILFCYYFLFVILVVVQNI